VAHDLQNRPQTGPEVWMERSEPRLPRPPSPGRRNRPARYRPGTVWVVLGIALVLIGVGMAGGGTLGAGRPCCWVARVRAWDHKRWRCRYSGTP